MKNDFYFTPEISEYEVRAEGILCVSDPENMNGADAGYFEENQW